MSCLHSWVCVPKCPTPAGDGDLGEGRPRLLLWLSRDAERRSWAREAGLADLWRLPRGAAPSGGDRGTPHSHEGHPEDSPRPHPLLQEASSAVKFFTRSCSFCSDAFAWASFKGREKAH